MLNAVFKSISLSRIVVPPGRELDIDNVEKLAATIEERGLINPITVIEQQDGSFRLVSGLHRLEAIRSLGWDRINAQVQIGEFSEIDIRLMEISENIDRTHLSAEQISIQLDKYRLVKLEKGDLGIAQVGQHVTNVKGSSGREGGMSAAARKLGIDRKKLQRAEAIANIDPDVRAAAKEAGLTTQRDLLKIAATPEDKQMDFIEELKNEKARGRKTKEKQADLCPVKGVGEIVQEILRDFSDTDVRQIIDRLSDGLSERAVTVPLKEPVRGADNEANENMCESESDQEVMDGQTAPCDPDTDEEMESLAGDKYPYSEGAYGIDMLDDLKLEDLNLNEFEVEEDATPEMLEDIDILETEAA